MPDTTTHTDCIGRGTTPCHGTAPPRSRSAAAEHRSPAVTGTPNARLDREDEIRRRYPRHQPADFDPTYAGERWDED